MALINKTYTFTAGTVIVASEHNTNFDTLYNEINGNLDNSNIKASAGIVDTKLAQITTAGKVSGASLTSLGSIPTGGGTLPSKNGGTGSDLSAVTVGAATYFSATGVISAFSAGTSGQVYVSGGAGAPSFANALSSVTDYGTSTSSGTSRQATAIKLFYGQYTFASNGSQAITNLTFTSTSSFQVVNCSGYGVTTTEDIRIVKDSGSQFTIYNDVNRACTVGWIAIGT